MAVTANQLITAQNPGGLIEARVVASKRLYQGTLAFGVGASGYATDAIATTVNPFLGVVRGEVDNSSGASGAKSVELYTEGVFEFTTSSAAQSWVGGKIYGVDNFTVNATSTSQPLVGWCTEYISATKIRVQIKFGLA